jgi:hypothetical protein
LRALLAFLYVFSNGERSHFDGFWRMMVDPSPGGPNDTGRAYIRRTHAQSHYWGIVRCLGIERTCPNYARDVARLRTMSDPATRARHLAAAAVREMGHEHEIIASKGHPRTAGARRLLARRIAAGEPIDSSDLVKKSDG